jgi:glycosyltransferase involved in cell wall biosynthesis
MRQALSTSRPRVFLASNLMTARLGNRAVMEDLHERLLALGYDALTASRHPSWLGRTTELFTRALVDRRRYDVGVVDVYSGNAFLWAEGLSLELHALRRPFVLVLRGGSLPAFAARYPTRVRACLNRADAVVAPSGYLVEQMKPYRRGIELIPNPLPIDRYRFRLREAPRPELVWLRTFRAFYNPTLAVRVVALLADEFPRLRLAMYGHDDGDGSLQASQSLAAELGVSHRIRFAGSVPKPAVPEHLDAGDILLNTPQTDNTPVSVMEAMAGGMCVVSTDVGGLPYLLRHDADALLVPRDEPYAMAGAVRRILTEQDLACRLSAAARASAEAWDWTCVLPQWTELLGRVSRGRR